MKFRYLYAPTVAGGLDPGYTPMFGHAIDDCKSLPYFDKGFFRTVALRERPT